MTGRRLVVLVGRVGIAGKQVHPSPQVSVHGLGFRRDRYRLRVCKGTGRWLGNRLDGSATREQQCENDSPAKVAHDIFRNGKCTR